MGGGGAMGNERDYARGTSCYCHGYCTLGYLMRSDAQLAWDAQILEAWNERAETACLAIIVLPA
jgi:hypothetical protein